MNPTSTRQIRRMLAVASTAAMVLVACGDGGGDDEAADDVATTESTAAPGAGSTAGDVEAYCEAALAIETLPEPAVDFETAAPDEIQAAMTDYRDALRPLADDVLDVAPDDIADDLDVLSAAIDEIGTSDEEPFGSPEVGAAQRRVHAFDLDNCGWNVAEVTAADYRFDGLPAELPVGPTSFDMTNEGAELHQLLLARINDGVTESAEEIVQLSEEEAFALITVVPGDAFAAPGEGDYFVADLDAGRYIVACFIPVGTTGDGPPPEGPPHALHGMFAELTVE